MGQIEAAQYFREGGPIQVVVDTTWGDGGKGKVVDSAGGYFDAVVRYGGGPNAGHTVYRDSEVFKFHGVPSSILHPDTLSVIASAVVVNPLSLAKEITDLQQRGVEVTPNNLLISGDAHLIMPWHRTRDGLNEVARGGEKIGTTGQGIGPTYSDRALRVGLRVGDLMDPQSLEQVFDRELRWQEELAKTMRRSEAGVSAEYDRDEIWRQLLAAREVLVPFIGNAQEVLWGYEDEDRRILGEGAQGALLDLDLGGYPYVTSSHPGKAGFELATGIHRVDQVVGVTKAYATRVGEGPMPTELNGDPTGEELRERGGEFGATTGRARRCGWFDAVAARYGARISGVDALAITKLDILDKLPAVRICVGYEIDGVQYKEMTSADPRLWGRAKPIYETLPGWDQDTSQVRSFVDLPKNAQTYLLRIQELVGKPVDIVSVGPQAGDAMYQRLR